MLLIAITQIFLWIFISLLILTVILSLKGILSPKFTLLLFLFLGGAAILCSSFSPLRSQRPTSTDKVTILKDSSEVDTIIQNNTPSSKPPKPIVKILKSKPTKNKIDEQENEEIQNKKTSTINNTSIEEYSQVDVKFRTYQTIGSLRLGQPFMTYFEEQTGWRKTRNGSYKIEVSHLGSFTQENKESERLYIYSGGEVEIKVNGKICCCGTIFSIPGGISDSKLVKARGKLKQSISDLMFDHKESVVKEMQKCL